MASTTLRAARRAIESIARRRLAILTALASLTPALLVADVMIGPSGLTPTDVIRSLLGWAHSSEALIVWEIRLPVALAALLVGVALGTAGSVMQTILDNPLASPYTLGIAAGAAFGAAMVYALGAPLLPWMEAYAVTLNAVVFALVAVVLVYTLGRLRGFTSEALVLAGIAVSYAFHSLLALMEYMASEEALQAIVFWLFGSLYKATWEKLAVLAAIDAIIVPLLVYRAWRLTALRLGDERAKSLGVEPRRERIFGFMASSLLTATAVAFHGVIGFVGLVAPHVSRMLVGEDQRFQIPASALTGASILLLADMIGKSVSPGAVIPVGIVTSLIGIPFFVALIALRRGEEYWSR